MDTSVVDYPYLPIEIIMHIMSYLSVADKMTAGLVCKLWHEASLNCKFIDEQVVVVGREEDNLRLVDTLSKSSRPFYNFIFKNVEIKSNFAIWNKLGATIRSLCLVCCDLSERTLVNILKCCPKLRSLSIDACRECLISGKLLEDTKDTMELRNNFQSLTWLSLAANRYLSDALFNRLVFICPQLQSLNLTHCQISFHSAVYKRFYPNNYNNDTLEASESLLTFFHILKYIEKHACQLKYLSFESTLINSTALNKLVDIPELQLESLKLKSCDQLTNVGIKSLIQQTALKVLDISFCNQITDTSLLYICQNLKNIENLNIQACQAITDFGISQIRLLFKLKKLNISECCQLTGACITDGLCRKDDNPSKSMEIKLIENLEILSAHALNLDENSIDSIAKSFPKLRHLDIGSCCSAITDKTIQTIFKELKLLRVLILSRGNVSDAGLTGMGADNRVHQVEPRIEGNVEISEAKLRIRLGSRAEEEIRLDAKRKKEVMEMCEELTPLLNREIIPEFSLLRLQGLKELNLMGCNRVTDVSLKHVFMFPELKILNLSQCQQITQVGLNYLTMNNRAIEDLKLSDCHNVTDLGIQWIAQRLHRLKRLHIRNCSQLTDQSIQSIKLFCKNLQYLDAASCPRITVSIIEIDGRIIIDK